MKVCTRCKIEKLFSSFNRDSHREDGHTSNCKKCISTYYFKNRKEFHERYRKNYTKNTKEFLRENNERKYKHRYGITMDEKQEKIDNQKGRCAICNELLIDFSNAFIDHNHETKQIRGILCSSCNSGLGMFKDSPEILQLARNYLLTFPASSV